MKQIAAFWKDDPKQWFERLQSSSEGLSESAAAARQKEAGASRRQKPAWLKETELFLRQYSNPLVMLLLFAATLSFLLREYADSLIVLAVLLLTGLLGFLQERNAGRAMAALRAMVHSLAMVRREGRTREIPVEEVVPGDIVLLNAGDMVPADALILEANDLHVNESVLTGESFPSEKYPGSCPEDSISRVSNAVFKGTSVVTGTATVLCIRAGLASTWGQILGSLTGVASTAFEKGIRRFGWMLMRLTVLLSGLILIINILLHKPLIGSVLFALALAVGLAPELLPAIVTVTLAAGARRMAARRVIVRRLSAIQNLGEMDILCSDKTGTITEGRVELLQVEDASGNAHDKAAWMAFLNASFESGFSNPVDEAIRAMPGMDFRGFEKRDEIPYDFIRKRLSILAAKAGQGYLISKGAVPAILDICSHYEDAKGTSTEISDVMPAIRNRFEILSRQGFRVLGIAYKSVPANKSLRKADEGDLLFLGFAVLHDPLKPEIKESVSKLKEAGVAMKIITGDNRYVAAFLAGLLGLRNIPATGEDLFDLSDEALQRWVIEKDVFAEIIPAQKARIVRALRKAGHTVGYLGDGINDVNALEAADVGISIHNAVDVARETADLVLLDRDVDVIRAGIVEGRKTFANTIKYIIVTTSANFGNMISMALASLFLPFLPLLPVQILLNNFLSDLPSVAIASDQVDPELVQSPRKWDMRYIRKFMLVFGIQSSLFDFATFALLIFVYHAAPEEFRTAWFMESLLTEILVLLVIRTGRPFYRSQPSRYLLLASLFTFLLCLLIPYLPASAWFGLFPLPADLMAYILLLIGIYLLMAEWSKRLFFSSHNIKLRPGT